jgi:beta-glucanase (GH16 family)
MTARSAALAALLLLTATQSASAEGNSWWGGEVLANQSKGKGNGIGYGLYEATMIPSTGQGSITGFFNICYTPDDYSSCIDYNKKPQFHVEVDTLEFTPLGDESQTWRNWIDTCTSDAECTVYHPSPWPRTNDGNLKAVSFNTFPSNNQVYAKLKFNPYADYHEYSVLVLPNKIVWRVDGEVVLSRTRRADVAMRRLDSDYDRFDQLLRNGQLKLIFNLWDGSQGKEGGFGGPPSTRQTTGQEARVQRVAYYAATCNGDECTLPDQPSFLTDFAKKKFVKDGVPYDLGSADKVCDTGKGNRTFWQLVYRNAFPVYVSPNNVNCTVDRGIYMYMTKNPMP